MPDTPLAYAGICPGCGSVVFFASGEVPELLADDPRALQRWQHELADLVAAGFEIRRVPLEAAKQLRLHKCVCNQPDPAAQPPLPGTVDSSQE